MKFEKGGKKGRKRFMNTDNHTKREKQVAEEFGKPYTMDMKCGNCGAEYPRLFSFGISSSGFYECIVCGCKEARSTGLSF